MNDKDEVIELGSKLVSSIILLGVIVLITLVAWLIFQSKAALFIFATLLIIEIFLLVLLMIFVKTNKQSKS